VYDYRNLTIGIDHGKKKYDPVWGLYSGNGGGYARGPILRAYA